MSFADNIKQNYKPVQNNVGPEQCRIVAQQLVDIAKKEMLERSQHGITKTIYTGGLFSRTVTAVYYSVSVDIKSNKYHDGEYKYPHIMEDDGTLSCIWTSKSGYRQLFDELKHICSIEGINLKKEESPSHHPDHFYITFWVEV